MYILGSISQINMKSYLNNYIEGEKSIDNDVDTNASELNINEG